MLDAIQRHGNRDGFRRAARAPPMALTRFQRDVCRLLADARLRQRRELRRRWRRSSTSFLGAPRLPATIDLFHDTEAALAASWAADRGSLESSGYRLSVVRERPTLRRGGGPARQ